MLSPLLPDLENHQSPSYVQFFYDLPEKGIANIYVILALLSNCCKTVVRYYSCNEYLKCLISYFRQRNIS